MSKYIYILFVLLFISCSNEDDNLPTIDMEKLYGKWYTRKGCEDQNFVIYSEAGKFTSRRSNNENCSTNTQNTFESTATYKISKNEIYYDFITNSEIVIQGTDNNTYISSIETYYYQERIVELTDKMMVIEAEIKSDYRDESKFHTSTFYRDPQ
ncbi:hypothetical protein [uncultured Tenacibaculum sp.]|uniref:hypothetical protein n=1 Tax=uncultured Tenacibaculum sp. TaxID=174713 RepID=UPI00260AF536|nr:hypothetical protein [uncultured Tenacibaculum sp.]